MQESAVSPLLHRNVAAIGRPRSCTPERAFRLDNDKICMFTGKDGKRGTEYREVQ